MANITITVYSSSKEQNQPLLNPQTISINTNNIKYGRSTTIPMLFGVIGVAAHTITIAGNHTGLFPAGLSMSIVNSTDNNGTYTVSSSTAAAFNGTNTVITINETIPDTTDPANGQLSFLAPGTLIQYYDAQSSALVDYTIFEPFSEINLNDPAIQMASVVKIDATTVSGNYIINANAIVSSYVSSTAGETDLYYDMGLRNHATNKKIKIIGTIEAIDKAAGGNIKYSVFVADQTNKVIGIAGNHVSAFPASSTLTWAGSASNDGTYTVNGTPVYGGGYTYITVNQSIPSSTADGYITE